MEPSLNQGVIFIIVFFKLKILKIILKRDSLEFIFKADWLFHCDDIIAQIFLIG